MNLSVEKIAAESPAQPDTPSSRVKTPWAVVAAMPAYALIGFASLEASAGLSIQNAAAETIEIRSRAEAARSQKGGEENGEARNPNPERRKSKVKASAWLSTGSVSDFGLWTLDFGP